MGRGGDGTHWAQQRVVALEVSGEQRAERLDLLLRRDVLSDIPAAIAADSPPLEPPGVRALSQGLCDLPTSGLSVSVQEENSGRFVLASGIPPAIAARIPQARLGGAVEVRRPAKYW